MNSFRLFLQFIHQTSKAFLFHSKQFDLFRNLKYYEAWRTSLQPEHNSLVDESPWISFEAIELLNKYLTKDMKIFEWGSGGSTMYWAERTGEVFSVEHHPEWHKKVKDILDEKKLSHVTYYLIESESCTDFESKLPDEPLHYVSGDEASKGKKFEQYVKKIDEFPDEYFDLVMIDGRARPSCAYHAMKKVKKGGLVVFDNVETKYYKKALAQFGINDWDTRYVFGLFPYITHFSMTLLATKK